MPVSPSEIKEAQTTPERPKEKSKRDVAEFLRLAQERFKHCASAENAMRKALLDDLQFSVGKQWPTDIENQRQQDGRPCLTMNRAPQFLRQVTNEQRQQRPSTVVNPIGDKSDPKTAEALQGVIRHIEVISDADVAYDHAFDLMARTGRGYWRIITDYDGPESFELELFIRWIKNPFTVYMDPNCVMADKSDARWCFIIEDLDISENKSKYPESTSASLSDFASIGDKPMQEGLDKDKIRIAEYFYVEESTQLILKLSDGRTVTSDVYENMVEDHNRKLADFNQRMSEYMNASQGYMQGTALPPEPEQPEELPHVINQRQAAKRQVKWSKINALEIIEERDWPGKYIPVVELVGEDLDVDGARHVAGLIRYYKDPQRMYNYWQSAATEAIALAPKAPWVAAEGQLEGREEEWRQSNVRNLAVLQYKPKMIDGQTPAPQPSRNVAEAPIQAMRQMTVQADQDMKATTGIYDAALGNRGPDESGKAILARQKQTDTGTLNFTDNLSRSMRYSGRILIDLIPKIYTAPRIQRIVMPDGKVQQVGMFHSGYDQLEEVQQLDLMQGIKQIFDIGVGQYDVAVSTGPSYQSKRQEAAAAILELVRYYPPIMQIAGDYLLRNLDWPYANEIAERLKMTLPPQILASMGEDQASQTQQLASKLAATMQQLQLASGQLAEAQSKIQKDEIRAQSNERIKKMDILFRQWQTLMQSQTTLNAAQISTKAQSDQARTDANQDAFEMHHNASHELAMLMAEQGHEMNMAEAEQQHEREMAQLQPPQQSQAPQGLSTPGPNQAV